MTCAGLLKRVRVALAGVSALIGIMLVGSAFGQPVSIILIDLGLGLLLIITGLTLATQGMEDRRLSREMRQRAASVIARVDEVREKQSRHEYRQKVALERIERALGAVRADVEGQSWSAFGQPARELEFTPPGDHLTRVLFITSNGGGLGHLTRCLAVATNNTNRISAAIVTLSTAYGIVEPLGYDVEYVAGPTVSTRPWPQWHRQFSRTIHALLIANPVDAVVFDGTWVYRAVTEACDRLQIPLMWLCRGTWREGADRTQLDSPLSHCDRMLVPEDVSGAAPVVELSAPWVTVCAPVTISDRSNAFSREEACASLGLNPERRYVLVQIGGGNVGDVSEIEIATVDAVRECGGGFVPVIAGSPLSSHAVFARDEPIALDRVYPLGRHLKAFDFAVSAGGYNTVHENLAVGLPAVYVPSASTITDDQLARVNEVARQGLGLVARTGEEIAEAVASLCEEGALDVFRSRLLLRSGNNGADTAGQAIVSMARDGR